MTMRDPLFRGLRAATLAAAFAAPGAAQDAWTAPLSAGDAVAAAVALQETLKTAPERPAALLRAYEAFADAGASDAFVQALQANGGDGADLAYFAGFALQQQKRLGLAEAPLAAAAATEGAAAALEAWAWNAALRFDPDEALRRAAALPAASTATFHAQQARRAEARAGGRGLVALLLGLVCAAAAACALGRAARK